MVFGIFVALAVIFLACGFYYLYYFSREEGGTPPKDPFKNKEVEDFLDKKEYTK